MEKKPISLQIEGVEADILYHQYRNCLMKTLLVSFGGERRRVLSTLDGYRRVKFVANVYVPPALSDFSMRKYPTFRRGLLRSLKISPREISFLSTGADMDNLAVCKKFFQEFSVCCFATAGTGNALRTGIDAASYVERDGRFEYMPCTINIIIISNVPLTAGAMARAIITVTEAKTAALQDLDVRSASSTQHQATGTGTDNVIVVSGRDSGNPISWTGGHTKMGELIGVCARLAVLEALRKQEGRSLMKPVEA
jgi:adenosylcobinamide amidohydrolase